MAVLGLMCCRILNSKNNITGNIKFNFFLLEVHGSQNKINAKVILFDRKRYISCRVIWFREVKNIDQYHL